MTTFHAERINGGNGASPRHVNDFYPTPPEVTEALMNFLFSNNLILPFDTVWECACGNGDMVKVLDKHPLFVHGSDIKTGIDFLASPMPKCDWIITNPPFRLAEQFILRAWELEKPFAFLLKAQYWNSSKRKPLFRECRPNYVLPLTWRPDFTGQGNSLMDCMWCVWTREDSETVYDLLDKPEVRE